ncbi:protein KINESIN LIGHT CHAIN-RELATED 1-like [Curcuma longa]|uniref:protein KINESIN LIGHT CHAIN-RELATED 1-like n=1 Tax=Curcuma longa TaxID=136217 RepID=UPI003D9DEF65
MPGIPVDGVTTNEAPNELTSSNIKENSTPSEREAPGIAENLPAETHNEPTIEQLFDNVRELESSGDGSESRHSFDSDGEESRIDSELRHLVGAEMEAIRAIEEEEEEEESTNVTEVENGAKDKNQDSIAKVHSPNASSRSSKKSKRPLHLQSQSESNASTKNSMKKKNSPEKNDQNEAASDARVSHTKKKNSVINGTLDSSSESGLENPDLGPFYLKHARDLIASDNPRRALKYALRAAKSFEKVSGQKPSLDLAMSLHVTAAIYCKLGKFAEAVPVLQKSIEIPVLEEGQDHALAKFSGCMQLGDVYAMLGQLDSSLRCYSTGLEIQKQTLGDMDPRVGETCRYLAEAHVQALQFDEAERLCQMALDIHREKGEPSSLEETADRRLMGLICDAKGRHEVALQHLVSVSMAMVAYGQETEVASVDCSIGDIYLSLGRYDEAVFAYQKALDLYKTTKGATHPTVASVFVRLADLYNKTGKFKESKSYCDNALRIYTKSIPGTSAEETAIGLTDVSAIYESMNEHEQALKLLEKALKMYNNHNSAGQQSAIAGIEAQIGVLHYVRGNYGDSYLSFKSAIDKLRACGEKKSAFFGIALNQMGLACVQRYAINEAAELFEEARTILEQERGPYHPDTLGVYSNLAGTYDAMGRSDEAIDILQYVVGLREEKLGTANPDVDDEKRRLAELLKEAGRVRNRKLRSLETLLDTNPRTSC